MQELSEDPDPSCAGSFPALPREVGGPPAPQGRSPTSLVRAPASLEPLARGSLSTLAPAAPGQSGLAAPLGDGPQHAAAQVQQFRRLGGRSWGPWVAIPVLVGAALVALSLLR